MSEWLLKYKGFDPDQEGLREALCTLGNGYFATRGAAAEAEDDGVHYPGTYLAGGYNRLTSHVEGQAIENEDLVNIPNWLPLNFRIDDGDWFTIANVTLDSYEQTLDMHEGILHRKVEFTDQTGKKLRYHSRRLVHMGFPHLAAIQLTLTPLNFTGTIEFRSALDGTVTNNGVPRYRKLEDKHLDPLETHVHNDTILLTVITNQSRIEISQAARTRVYSDGQLLDPERTTDSDKAQIAQNLKLDAKQGQPLTVEKIVTLYTSRDHAISNSSIEALKDARNAKTFNELADTHKLAWENLWSRIKVDLQNTYEEEKVQMQAVLNLYTFHILQTTSRHSIDLDVGVPSRGWHGEAYRGHILWDELFIFPFLNIRMPSIGRALLLYRYRRLKEARAAAREQGYKGAMFPWQSGSNGREESQKIHYNPKSGRWIPDNSRLQRHVNAAIAYNVWKYYEATADISFLCNHGAEMIWEIARFWSSKATWNEDLQRYEIHRVMGPDEYHDGYPDTDEPGLNNNSYTNIMVVWLMNKALKLYELLPEYRAKELSHVLGITKEETERWKHISQRMRIVFHGDGIISQFEGYDKLQEFDWEGYKKRYGNIQRLDRILESEDDTPNRYKLAKQADVLMLFYLFSSEQLNDLFTQLGYEFDRETIPRNINYYIDRTSHGSTLSWVAHSWVLSRSDREGSWDLFKKALQSDIADIQGGTTPEGIHLGAMAGTVALVQKAYTGMDTRDDTLVLNPCLPEHLAKLELRMVYRGHPLFVKVETHKLTITKLCDCPGPVNLDFRGKMKKLNAGQTLEFKL
ncbi:putative glycosyl hydrolase [Anaerohalosphaera lusitana]|uniref:Putative glycosyl hydrolase n=1 Tax=Anaerohalosphaera lusitana TaxID=1936003 RepID=A0A1U9NKL5_9BACT|nr:glycosyl hydrolase family 65 protein [Anaerohalosphaera lusitana]AQT68449.1 putative glycosyl hydrolase [Anaerohalosphaera lusitana]